jgi:tetratricopeptide (TPR) repeat protein
MEHAFGLLDAGKYEEALAAFQIVLQSGDPLAQRALLGMAELFEKLGDNETRLSMAKGAFEFDDRTLKLAMVQLHYLPLMWPRDEEVSQDPNLAGRMRAELVVHAASFLPEDNPESDLDHEVAIFVSNAANQVLFHFDSRVVEAQLHASFILAVDSADLKIQYRAMRNIHSFFSGILPSEVSAILVINKVSTSWSHFNNVIGQLDRCEQDLQTLIGRSLSDDELAAIAAEFDRLMEAPDYNFYNAYFAFGMLVDYLQSPQVNRQSLLVQVLIEKYLS